ncbi:MAG TPA: ABC transporter ATP-binding protein [Candidatus Saccharimonadales bacterium]|jgi:ABC-2 type transport system ATP-binding protein|nr:ABC transporter ATP-binding protein [Candidatus Saccharimonadales bacterium]
MAALEIQGLAKSYPAGFWRKTLKAALLPLNLTVEEGETFGFLGPNGAGKTTTLKLLMGIIFPTSGSARILGRHFHDPEVRRQIGFLPEQPYFYDYLNAQELLDYYGSLSGLSLDERKTRVPAVLERVGLADAGRQQLRKFSKGMLQRVGIAQAILHQPQMVFLDEPMSGLDPVGRREIRELLQGLKEEGKTVFFSTHILSDAESLCDRVAVIHKGELQGIGVMADLKSQNAARSEVVWRGAPALNAVSALLSESHVAGDIVRAVVAAANVEALLEKLRQQRASLISLTPVQGALEDYFISQTSGKAAVRT